MIQANELRIGNWVTVSKQDKSYIERIQSISSYSGKFNTFEDPHYDRIETINPIPLTEKWLVKFGFNKIVGWDDFTFFRKKYVDIDVNNDGYYFYKPKIQYVHQLQNLYFALTGEELTLKK